MSDDFDAELRRRFAATAGEVERSPAARWRPAALRSGRLAVPAVVAAGVAVLVVATFALPRLGGPADPPVGLAAGSESPTPGSGGDPSPSEQPTPSERPTPSEQPTPSEEPEPSEPPTPRPTIGSPSPSEIPWATPHPMPPAYRCGPAPRSEPKPPGVVVSVAISHAEPAPGDTVTLTVRVRNDGATPVRYQHGGYRYDLWVTTPGGSMMWLYSHERAFTAELQQKTLAPGEEVTAEETWDVTTCGPGGEGGRPLQEGNYVLHGAWVSGGAGLWHTDTPVEFTVR